MKKIIFILMFAAIGFAAQSQTLFKSTVTQSYATESAVLNATVDTLLLTLSGNYNETIQVQCRLTKTGGTIAGTVRLYGSLYGTTSTWVAIGDTLTLSNAAINQHNWVLTGGDRAWKYLRILQDGGTTMSGTLSAKALGIKP